VPQLDKGKTMKTPFLLPVAAFLQALVAVPAFSQATTPWYIGAGLGVSRAQHACTGLPIGVSCDESDTSWKAYGGYRLARYFAVEGGGGALGDVRAQTGATVLKISGTELELSALGIVPLTSQFSLFGRFGGYRSKVNVSGALTGSKSSGNATYGIGMDFNLTRNVDMRAEWQRYQSVRARDDASGAESTANVNVVGAGVLVRF
jgi:OOP family OmpA-OmpF porin